VGISEAQSDVPLGASGIQRRKRFELLNLFLMAALSRMKACKLFPWWRHRGLQRYRSFERSNRLITLSAFRETEAKEVISFCNAIVHHDSLLQRRNGASEISASVSSEA
jgi:hypothetical protein